MGPVGNDDLARSKEARVDGKGSRTKAEDRYDYRHNHTTRQRRINKAWRGSAQGQDDSVQANQDYKDSDDRSEIANDEQNAARDCQHANHPRPDPSVVVARQVIYTLSDQ
jgi:hypothetical protein